MKKLFITIFLSLSLIVSPIDALAYSGKPVNSYTGPSGVTIRSFTSSYSSLDKLKGVYNELMKNAIGEEIKYLSHIDLVGDYPYGEDTGGMWYGEWENNKLEKGRYFEIFGADTITFTELAKVLSHEYGHHFTYYHLNKGEQIDSLNIMESGFSDIRKLKSYKSIDNDIHSWSPAEIAAEDYVQLFGSSTGKESVIFKDVRDYLDSGSSNDTAFSSLIYNLYPQENFSLPLAWQIEGYYQYWSKLSGVSIHYNRPPSAPLLGLTEIDGGSHTLTWTKSLDDRTEDIEYTVVYTRDEDTEAVGGIRTTTDSNGRDAIIGTYERGRMTAKDNVLSSKVRVRVYAKDEDGNIVASNDLVIDPENPQNSLTKPVERIAGLNRYETSAAISRAGWEGNSDYAVLATGENFPDALSAAPLAKKYNAPILLTGRAKLDKKVDMELKRLKVKNVFIVGGTGVISSEVETYLKDEGLNTTRIYGSNRYETSVEVAKHLGEFDKVILATGEDFPDALSIAPFAAVSQIPIILTQSAGLSESVDEYLKDKSVLTTYVIGGPGVIKDMAVKDLTGVKRVYGSNRYATNLAVIKEFKDDFKLDSLYIATGADFPDALSGSALASLKASPIMLISKGNNDISKDYIKSNYNLVENLNILGGNGVVSNDSIIKLSTGH